MSPADLELEVERTIIELEARLAFPELPPWKAIVEFVMQESREMVAAIELADASRLQAIQNPYRREFRDRAA